MPPREVVAVGGAGGRLVEAGTRHCSREGLVLVLVGFRCGTFFQCLGIVSLFGWG